ncbi:hypothetical protein DQW50_16465 [Halorubrum sp. 48-1-W]|uniref:hypothetical protein n=1 Tax=Halorubrum sp. 48-1-W TaxID=2249761 RepID=UPI000DCCC094|nr:hypothetical protein [Halorubrum sp. 48-1-W]RAW44049.1 hypothetical protein DQW50_16465 [Halorubrum sp. 48-1-W]
MSTVDADGSEDATAEDEDVSNAETESVDSLEVVIRAEVLQQVVDQMLTVVDEAILRIGYDGLSIAAVDPANIAMVDLEVEPGAFESVGDGMFPIGLNLQKLDDYIDGASGADPVRLEYLPERRSIHIEHTNVEVEMAGINTDSIRQEPDIPEIDHSAEFEVDAKVFGDAVENAELVSDHVEFEADVDDRSLVVSAEGDTDDIRTVIGSDELLDANFSEGVTSLFSLSYLIGGSEGGSKYKGILKPLGSGTELSGKIDDEVPIFLDYDFADGFGHVTMMLAPRIQND